MAFPINPVHGSVHSVGDVEYTYDSVIPAWRYTTGIVQRNGITSVAGKSGNVIIGSTDIADFQAAVASNPKIANLTEGYLGYFADKTALLVNNATGTAGQFATVGSTNGIWVWDAAVSEWVVGGGSGYGGIAAGASTQPTATHWRLRIDSNNVADLAQIDLLGGVGGTTSLLLTSVVDPITSAVTYNLIPGVSITGPVAVVGQGNAANLLIHGSTASFAASTVDRFINITLPVAKTVSAYSLTEVIGSNNNITDFTLEYQKNFTWHPYDSKSSIQWSGDGIPKIFNFVSANPIAPTNGDIFYDETVDIMLRWDGYSWKPCLETSKRGTIAMGNRAVANAYNAISLGDKTESSAQESIAIGSSSIASGNKSVAIGGEGNYNYVGAIATNTYSIALGSESYSESKGSISIGAYATVSQSNFSGISIGYNSSSTGTLSVSVGNRAWANGSNSTALGDNARAVGVNSTSLGKSSSASTKSTVVGNNSTAAGTYGTVVGYSSSMGNLVHYSTLVGAKSTVSNSWATCIGSFANATGQAATSLGNGSNAAGSNSTALGAASGAAAAASTSVGSFSSVTGVNSTAVGTTTIVAGSNSTALGAFSVASNNNSSALGRSSNASGSNSSALGANSVSNSSDSTAVGAYSKCTSSSTVALGAYAKAYGQNSISIGYSAQASDRYDLVMGRRSQSYGGKVTLLGSQSYAKSAYSVCIGYDTRVKPRHTTSSISYDVAIGTYSKSYSGYSVAVGGKAHAYGKRNIALGYRSGSDSYHTDMISIGYNAKAPRPSSSVIAEPFMCATSGTTTPETALLTGEINLDTIGTHILSTPTSSSMIPTEITIVSSVSSSATTIVQPTVSLDYTTAVDYNDFGVLSGHSYIGSYNNIYYSYTLTRDPLTNAVTRNMFSSIDKITWTPIGTFTGTRAWVSDTVMSSSPTSLFVTSLYGGIWSSTDAGVTWISRRIEGVSDVNTRICSVGNVLLSVLTQTTTSLLKSIDDGITWTLTTPVGVTLTSKSKIINSGTDFYLYEHTGGGLVYKSADGVTWVLYATIPIDLTIWNVRLYISDAYIIYVTEDNLQGYRYTSDGITWVNVSVNQSFNNSISDIILVGTSIGILFSSIDYFIVSHDNGVTWIPIVYSEDAAYSYDSKNDFGSGIYYSNHTDPTFSYTVCKRIDQITQSPTINLLPAAISTGLGVHGYQKFNVPPVRIASITANITVPGNATAIGGGVVPYTGRIMVKGVIISH